MFGYDKDELIGQPLSSLLAAGQAEHHDHLVGTYMEAPSQRHAMASGRLVQGKRKDGSAVALEISLSVHELDGDKHAFASVVDVGKVHNDKSMLQESSNRLSRAIDASNDGIWEWNVQTGEVWYSNRLMHMIGRDAAHETPALDQWLGHIHQDDKALVQQILDDHFDKGEKYDIIYRGMSEFGDYQWMHTRGDTIFDDSGKPLLMSGTLTNIHELKCLEIELEQQTSFLNMVLNKSISGLYIFDLEDYKNVFINEQYTEILGYSLEELAVVEGLEGIYHPEDLALVCQHLEAMKSAKDDKKVSIEYRFKHKDGHWVWCLSQDSAYRRDEHGNVTQMIGTFVDVTPVKEREERITQLAKDFSATFEQAAVGIAHVSLDGNWLKVNNKICEILRYGREQLLALNFQQITHPDDLENDLSYVDRLIRGDADHYAIEKRYIRGDGQVVWAYLTVAIVRNEDGSNSHFISVVEDISERKSVEQALEESNKALERFAYSASHDMQEPLRKITAFSDSLQSRLSAQELDADSRYELARIKDAANRMRGMIKGLLELSRFSRQVLTKETCRLSELIQIVEDDLSYAIEESQANIELKSDVTLHVDKHNFQQLLTNLIGNAIRYRQEGRPLVILVWAETLGDGVTIHVKDNGVGFENQFNKAIFEPFQRLQERGRSGHGIGLAICEQIVRAHQGQITATSTPGEGACFTIQVPNNE
jgi:PAS domain S-box-containing protein